MKNQKISKGTYVVLNQPLMSCGCSEAGKGTIGKVSEELDEDGDICVKFCPKGCSNWISLSKIDYIESNQELLASLFKHADNFNYANISTD